MPGSVAHDTGCAGKRIPKLERTRRCETRANPSEEEARKQEETRIVVVAKSDANRQSGNIVGQK